MQVVQRALLLMTVVILLLTGIGIVYLEWEEKGQYQWECMQTECFLNHICDSGVLSLEDYMKYCNALQRFENLFEVRIEEYQREQDFQENQYYYLISWEELQKKLMVEEVFFFEAGNVVRMEIKRKGRHNNEKNSYYGIVSGEDFEHGT